MARRPKSKSEVRNDERRERYKTDPVYAENARTASRETYRKYNPPDLKLANGLLSTGQEREVICDEMDEPVVVESFSVPEAAKALGRSELTLRNWMAEELIPKPILEDATRHNLVYSVGELTIIAKVLAEHEKEYSYLTTRHQETQDKLWQAIQGFRATHI